MRSVIRSVAMNSVKRDVPLNNRSQPSQWLTLKGDTSITQVSFPRRAAKRPSPSTSVNPSLTAPSPALMMDMVSSKNLDLCLLAICSCVLSLLCHQPAGISAPHAAHFPASGANSAATPVRVDFLIKAGLVTTRQQEHDIEQDDDLA